MITQDQSNRKKRCALVEGPRWADCKFYAAWLAQVAEAEINWQQALTDQSFARAVDRLLVCEIPSFEIAASVLLMQLEQELNTFVVDLESENAIEFCMMISLDFFRQTGTRYQMTIPQDVSVETVKAAAELIVDTEDDEHYLHLEQLVSTMALPDAKAWQCLLRTMPTEQRMADRDLLLQ